MPIHPNERLDRSPAGALSDRSASHHLLSSTIALILAGGRGSRLKQLSERRAKPAMPFAGNLKVIDFTLSNCINSGLRRVAVLTQYKAQTLIRHVTHGWGFLDASLGEFIDVVPAQQRVDAGWYSGTADAVYQNLDMLRLAAPRYVGILAGDHVYKMDYSVMLAEHVRTEADLSVACLEVPIEQASAFGVMRVNETGRVIEFNEKPAQPASVPGRRGHALASMGIYIFNADFLYRELLRDAARSDSCHDFGGDIIPRALSRGRVHAHDFKGSCVNRIGDQPYWRDVGTLDAYWEANIDLISPHPELDLYDDAWPIRSLQHQLPPSKFVFDDEGRPGIAIDSLVASGCIVSGAQVRQSVLFSKVKIGEGSVIDDSLLLPGVQVGRHVVIRKAIIDKRCVVPDHLQVGVDPAEDRRYFTVSEKGVTLVTPDMLAEYAKDRHATSQTLMPMEV